LRDPKRESSQFSSFARCAAAFSVWKNGNLLKRQTMLAEFTVRETKGQSVIYSVAGLTSRYVEREREVITRNFLFSRSLIKIFERAIKRQRYWRDCTSLIVMVLSSAVPFNGGREKRKTWWVDSAISFTSNKEMIYKRGVKFIPTQ
jgi:hypothetical protein